VTIAEVIAILIGAGVQPQATPNGVEYSWYFDSGCMGRSGRHRFRVECGSGIGGRGGAWNVVDLPSGKPHGPKVTSGAELRRQVLESLAEGNRPDDRDGYETYARWHTCGTTSSVQWFQRRRRTKP
jgi:hypothetical protein